MRQHRGAAVQLIPGWDDLPTLSWKKKVALLVFRGSLLPQVEMPVTHHFADGVYIRELRVPKGTIIVGNEHLLGHEMQLIEGSIEMAAPDGRFHFDAFASMHTKPGYHAVVYTVTDMVSRTIHPNPDNSTDIESLEAKWFGNPQELIAEGHRVALDYEESVCLAP